MLTVLGYAETPETTDTVTQSYSLQPGKICHYNISLCKFW